VRTLVLGGIRSGKSRWAEAILPADAQVNYLATGGAADDGDPAWARRIAEHRQRRPACWRTVETVDVAGHLRAQADTPTLVDDLGGWLTAMLDRSGWQGPVGADVDNLVAAVDDSAADVVLVSPEVGLTVVPATESGRRFADELGALNQRIAACCQRVVLVVAGQPLWVKAPG
jgi:adenosylcobinamide kinase/adenosylcobinamide-phosphate guanylyltransferase